MLGDGNITPRQVIVDLNRENEKGYQRFINRLIKKLFKLNPSIYYRRTSNGIKKVVSSVELRDYLIKLGLNIGKSETGKMIPQWIFKNPKFQIGCLKGLMATDGYVFTHRYKVNGKYYSYKKLAFKNSSYPFLKSMSFSHPRITKNYREVRLESKADVQKYFQFIGFHNPKI